MVMARRISQWSVGTAAERRNADLFYAELMGKPVASRPLRRRVRPLAVARPSAWHDEAFAEDDPDEGHKQVVASSVTPWTEIIPDAIGAGRPIAKGHSKANGPFTDFGAKAGIPTTTYAKGVVQGPLGTNVTAAAVDEAVAAIRAARDEIRQRYFVTRVPNPAKHITYLGYEATPSLDSPSWPDPQALARAGTAEGKAFQQRDPSWQQITDASKAYVAWLADPTTKPSQVANSSDMSWRAFRKLMEWEGLPTAVNTWDQANVTFGAGFAGSAGGLVQKNGLAQELIAELCKRSTLAQAMFWNAGLTLDGSDFVVVDTDKQWKLRGMDAELFVRTNRSLLSLFVNLAQGVFIDSSTQTSPNDDLRQKALDANFELFSNHALKGISTAQLGSDVDLAALKLHAAHSGSFGFGTVSSYGSVPALVSFIYNKLYERALNAKSTTPVAKRLVGAKAKADAIVVEPKWRSIAPPMPSP